MSTDSCCSYFLFLTAANYSLRAASYFFASSIFLSSAGTEALAGSADVSVFVELAGAAMDFSFFSSSVLTADF